MVGLYPNQYLHADITEFTILPLNTKYYIYIVKDNYSKLIKSYAISTVINKELRVLTFIDAINDVKLNVNNPINFITDSGPENKNKLVECFLKLWKGIKHFFAKKDIIYSNSMVERFNMDLKYLYLYRQNITSYKQLENAIQHAIHEHNYKKTWIV